MRDLEFKTDSYDPYTIVHNIGEINKLIQDLKPGIEQCLDNQKAEDGSSPEGFEEIRKWLDIFSDPSNTDIYDTTLKVVKNWDKISKSSETAIIELSQGRCARAGYVFGKLIREIMLTEASLTDAISVGADVTYK